MPPTAPPTAPLEQPARGKPAGVSSAAAQRAKRIEARELIIALPEIYTQYEPQQVLTDFTEEFRRGMVECGPPLHHNKRKTNYHIHLIFSEREVAPRT